MKKSIKKAICAVAAALLMIVFSVAVTGCGENGAEEIGVLERKLECLMSLDWDTKYSDDELLVYVKPECSDTQYCLTDFEGAGIVDVERITDEIYVVVIETPGIKGMINAIVHLFDMEFVNDVTLNYVLSGA